MAEVAAGTVSGRPAESATRGTVLLSTAHAIALVATGGVHILAGRLLSEEGYGRFAVVLVVLLWTNLIAGSSILLGVRKVLSEDGRRYHAALAFVGRWYAPLALGLGLLFYAVPWLPARLFGDPALVPLFRVAGLVVPLVAVVNTGVSLLSSVRRFGEAGAVRASYAVCSAAGACVLLAVHREAVWGLGGWVAGAGLAALIAGGLLAREGRGGPREAYPAMGRRVVRWAVLALPVTVGVGGAMTVDLWLVKGLVPDAAAAGVYAAAVSLSRFPMFLVHGLAGAVFPRVSGAWAAGTTGLARSVASEAMRLVLVAFAPVCFITLGAATEIAVFVYGPRYAGAGPSLVVLIVAMFCAAQSMLTLRLLAAADRLGERLAVAVAMVLLASGCGALLVPAWGPAGAAWASLIAFGVGAAAGTALVFRHLGAAPPRWTAVRCVAAGALVCVLSRAWPTSGWWVPVKLAALSAAYLLVLCLIRELRREDAANVWRGLWH
jgi:O-antigen/teichoic acid export membrane protein